MWWNVRFVLQMQISCIDLKSPKAIRLADSNLKEPPLCMSANVKVLLAVNNYVLVVNEDELQQQGVGNRPLQKMVVSPYGN
ncbi:hypothetical protein SUGI_0855500 [Cryptomeria japonica]|nr:hypothetical protein SUGI_0855500 [Cryptomeria japonica]